MLSLPYEVWRDVVWAKWMYRVSNVGSIKSFRHWIEKTLKPGLHKQWYLWVNLSIKGWLTNYVVHRLVAQAFLPNPNNKRCVNHKNWIKTDNRVENLEWCTYSENMKHSFAKLWNIVHRKGKIWIMSSNSKKVNQFTLEGVLIKQWYSAADVQRDIWIGASGISECCNWKRKTSWWYVRKYAELIGTKST